MPTFSTGTKDSGVCVGRRAWWTFHFLKKACPDAKARLGALVLSPRALIF